MTDSQVRDVVIREAGGSPRQMLVNLAVCLDAKDRREAGELVRGARDVAEPVVELCKALMGGASWPKVMGILEQMSEEPTESIRIQVCNYVGGALRRAKSDDAAIALLSVIEPFTEPFPAGSDKAALVVAAAQALFAGD